MKKLFFTLFAVVLFCPLLHAQKFDGLALTPPMGWNSWNKFACDVNEALLRETADAMAANGMKEAGYQYIIIDDCWHGQRDSLGFIHPDPKKFPSGMKALAEYIHSKGLKFGIYSCAGIQTCAGYPGGRGHEYQDAITYAQWGVDYLKYDWCNTDGLSAVGSYTTMRDALHAAGRPVVFSLCEWGNNEPWKWAPAVGHLWRTTGDISACFDCENNHGTWSSWGVMRIVEQHPGIRVYAGPGHWNDPDMLEVGNGMSFNEDRSHFSLWCILAAPLISGNDLRAMSPETKDILTNTEVIGIDQDSLGVQGYRFDSKDSVEVWVKPLMKGDWAVAFLNRSTQKRSVDFDWSKNIITDDFYKRTLNTNETKYNVRNLWVKKNIGTTKKNVSAELGVHEILMLRLIKQ